MQKYLKRGIATDAIIVKGSSIVLIKRKCSPYKGYFALPGGYVDYNETCEKACQRELMEETGLKVKVKKLVGVYSNPNRDPRAHTISVCYQCSVLSGDFKSGDDAAKAYWIDLNKLPKKLAFDHEVMIQDYQKIIKNKT